MENSIPEIPILYMDEHIVVVSKPAGLLVHKTKIAEEQVAFLVQYLRDQIGKKVYPAHRLDRKTSGVLVCAIDKEADAKLQANLRDVEAEKYYVCLVRGFLPDKGIIDSPLKKENGKLQEAKTLFAKLDQTTIDVYVSKYPQSRYSIGLVLPKSGRMHQIRRHMAHIRHYIIGDLKHGECKHNKMFKEKMELNNMLLHAWRIRFKHPITNEWVEVEAPFPSYFEDTFLKIGLNTPVWKEEYRELFTENVLL